MRDVHRSPKPPANGVAELVRSISSDVRLPDRYAVDALRHMPAVSSEGVHDQSSPARAAFDALALTACEATDHAAELRVGRAWLEASEDDSGAERLEAWAVVLRALQHLADVATGDGRQTGLEALAEAADEAHADLDRRWTDEGVRPKARRQVLDGIAEIMLAANDQLGRALPGPAIDVQRRKRARDQRGAPSLTFLEHHAAGITAIWARDSRDWYRQRYVDRQGIEPPDGWWIGDPQLGQQGHVAAGMRDLFDAGDHAAFLEEMEIRYRLERGLPAKGEGWVSQIALARCLEDVLPGVEIVHEARPSWLGTQRLDIFLPSLGLAIEYQGEQHYVALEHWGGEEGLVARRQLDERKREVCLTAGVILIEWRYDDPIGVEAVRRRLQERGFVEPE